MLVSTVASVGVEANIIISALDVQGVDTSYARTLADCYALQDVSSAVPPPSYHSHWEGVATPNRRSCSSQNCSAAMKSLDWDEEGIRMDGGFLSDLRLADEIVLFSNFSTSKGSAC